MAEVFSNPVGEYVRKLENDFVNGTVTKSKYVEESPFEDITKIEAYLASKHTSGLTDSLGREKPFFNIGLAARNIWFRATDIDRKHVAIQHRNALVALVAKIYLQDWMNRNYFGQFLNAWGLNLAAYNESVVKFVEQGGELKCMVVPWSKLLFDPIDFVGNPKVEVLELTPAQLRKRVNYDQKIVEKLLGATSVRKTLEKQQKDNKDDYIKLYEVHGEFPLSYLTGKEKDKDDYVQQMHVVSFVASKEDGEFDDFTLYSGKEAKDPYMLTALLPEVDGSVGFNGAIKNLFDAQWMQNHSIKSIKDHLDLASKLIFQTSDGNFVGQNALTAIEQGDILIHKQGQPLAQLNNSSHDITNIQNFQNQWKVLSNEINGISEAMLGQNPPSGTAWRQTQALLNESHSLFEVMTENKGLAIEMMLREYILPHIKRKLKNTKELVAALEDNDIRKIDGMYLKKRSIEMANEEIKRMVREERRVPNSQEQIQITQGITQKLQEGLAMNGNIRTLKPSEVGDKTWADIFKDLEWDAKVNIVGEAMNDKDMLDTIVSMLQIIGNNPQALQNPAFALPFNRALALTGAVSPVEFDQVAQESRNAQPSNVSKLELPAQNAEVGATSNK